MQISKDEPSRSNFYVVTLKPDGNLSDFIAKTKSKTKDVVGDQQYLSHPPHMTLYVAAFEDLGTVVEASQRLASKQLPIEIQIDGWHSFGNDSLTGGHTLVCNLESDCRAELRRLQTQVISTISTKRDVTKSRARYEQFFEQLDLHRQQAVIETGFPFVGDDWIPHLTIASFDSSRWTKAWELVKANPPEGGYSLEGFEIFVLENDFPKHQFFVPFARDQ